MHASPKDELEAVIECELGDLQCQLEATWLLDDWDRNNTPLEMQRAQADFFFVKWNFTDDKGRPWRPTGTKDQ